MLRKGLSDTGLPWNTCYDRWCLISSWNRAPVSQKPSIVFHLVLHQRKYCQFQGVKNKSVCPSPLKKNCSTAIISRCQFLRTNLKSEKKMCAVTLHWYRHGYFYLSRRGKKDYFMYVPWMDTMGAILLCQAVKPVGKQGPVIELESHADALSVLVRFWLRGLGILQFPSAKLFVYLMIHAISGRCFFVAQLFHLWSEW